jgi:hypothetical protein
MLHGGGEQQVGGFSPAPQFLRQLGDWADIDGARHANMNIAMAAAITHWITVERLIDGPPEILNLLIVFPAAIATRAASCRFVD